MPALDFAGPLGNSKNKSVLIRGLVEPILKSLPFITAAAVKVDNNRRENIFLIISGKMHGVMPRQAAMLERQNIFC